MKSLRAVVGLALALSACGPKGQEEPNQASVTEKTTSPVRNVVPEENQGTSPAPGAAARQAGDLSPAGGRLRFVGTWATNKNNCASKPWRFTPRGVNATSGPQCSFYKVTSMPGGYDLAAQCPTKKPVETDLVKLRFGSSSDAMLVESNAIPPTGLVYCGK